MAVFSSLMICRTLPRSGHGLFNPYLPGNIFVVHAPGADFPANLHQVVVQVKPVQVVGDFIHPIAFCNGGKVDLNSAVCPFSGRMPPGPGPGVRNRQGAKPHRYVLLPEPRNPVRVRIPHRLTRGPMVTSNAPCVDRLMSCAACNTCISDALHREPGSAAGIINPGQFRLGQVGGHLRVDPVENGAELRL